MMRSEVTPKRSIPENPMSRIQALGALLLICPLSGCALLAKKTPTPAAEIDGEALARTPRPPNERFYLILFGSHDALHHPKYSHTWGTLVRAISVPGEAEPKLEVHTISWFPATLDIHPARLTVEPGKNFSLAETFDSVLGNRENVAMWGPYEVWHGFAHRFLVQKTFLESGAVGYQCDDSMGEAARTGHGCACMHALTDMDPVYARWRYPLALYGQPATANLVRRIMHSPVTIDGTKTHDWLICRLGLSDYPIERRSYHGRIAPYYPGAADLQEVPLAPKLPIPKNENGKPEKKP